MRTPENPEDFIKEWETTEINPQEIAEALKGRLIKRDGLDTSWDIHLYYGRRKPVITLMLAPEKRNIFLAFPAMKFRDEQAYRFDVKFVNVWMLRFYTYPNPVTNQEQTDMYIMMRDSGTNLIAEAGAISSHAHLSSISLNKNSAR
ncbi:hypothetical protein HYW46_06310 [Candidatus Daviesbacteria bacterium]|nr:hypothetical protein [Candidatus Daviesbacteria bacterium]